MVDIKKPKSEPKLTRTRGVSDHHVGAVRRGGAAVGALAKALRVRRVAAHSRATDLRRGPACRAGQRDGGGVAERVGAKQRLHRRGIAACRSGSGVHPDRKHFNQPAAPRQVTCADREQAHHTTCKRGDIVQRNTRCEVIQNNDVEVAPHTSLRSGCPSGTGGGRT